MRGIQLGNNGLVQLKLGFKVILCRFDTRIFDNFKRLTHHRLVLNNQANLIGAGNGFGSVSRTGPQNLSAVEIGSTGILHIPGKLIESLFGGKYRWLCLLLLLIKLRGFLDFISFNILFAGVGTDDITIRLYKLQLYLLISSLFKVVMHHNALLGILSLRHAWFGKAGTTKFVGCLWLIKVIRAFGLVTYLMQHIQVIHNPERTSLRSEYQVFVAFVYA